MYDKLDRVVATGPAVSPFSNLSTSIGWLLTKYDAFNRPVLTAWWPPTTTTPATALGRKTLQDSYNGSTAVLNETKIATATNTTVNGVAYRYTNIAYPPATTFHVLTVNYYDDYNFPNAPTLPASVEGQTVYYNNTIKPIGLPTGSWIRVPETSTLYKNERSYSLYDSKARPIRSYTTNHLGGYTYVDSKIDFAGKTLYTITRHKRLSTSTELKTREDFSYSDQDRLLTQSHQINSQAKELLANNSYNELGQLTSKKVGSPLTPQGGIATWLQKIDYSYNIRGWLTGINDINNLTDATTPPSGAGGLDLFGFKINYNTPATASTTALFNGNIAETYWKTANDDLNRGYAYQYDNLNRLKAATYQKAGTVTNAYNESLTYDKNGNILTLNRNGTSETATAIDKLAYTYSNNQLLKVADTSNKTQGFVDGTNTDNDFTYDFNGNMKIDKNKGITAITYNHLNLPIKITFGTTGNIVYVYNATGQKLKKVVTQGTTVTTTDYLGGYQYVNNTLQFFPTAEGYVSLSGTTYSYTYQYKDHLGNIRLSYSDANNDKLITNNEIVEESNYYPFGLKQTGYNNVTNSLGNSSAQKYKYNGKEYQDELGLNLYDYGARNYDATIGRWMNIDPKAELLQTSSPYVYALNCPIIYLDKDGELPILINGKVSSDDERANEKYWTSEIVATILGSGIANPGGQIHYVDGDRYYREYSGKVEDGTIYNRGNSAEARQRAGYMSMTPSEFKSILSKLERNSDGKIIEKIQIYTHSRGAAFGVGYTERLLEFIKENASEFADANNVIDFVFNMAPHQSNSIKVSDVLDVYSLDRTKDPLSGNDMKGVKGAFTTNEGGFKKAHSISTFGKDLKAFTSAFLKGGTSKDLIKNFVSTMKKKYKINVTVEE